MKKLAALTSLFFVLVGAAAAAPPTLSLEPSTVDLTGNHSIPAKHNHTVEFTFTNQDSVKKIYNVTLPEKPYLSYSSNRFDLNASASRNVTVTVSTGNPKRIRDNFTYNITDDGVRDPVRYLYNDTSGNSSGLTFNAESFPLLQFNIDSYWVDTSVGTTALTNEFNLSLGESDRSVFELRNTGNETAYQVNLSGDDISFDQEQLFNLSATEDPMLPFTVEIPKPETNATEATNQTYLRTIRVSGENFPDAEIDLRVHVPYKEYSDGQQEDNESISPILEEFKEYCESTGNCSRIKETVYKNRTVYRNTTPVYPANFSNETVQALRELAENELEDDKATRQRVDLLKQAVKTDISQLNRSMRQMLQTAINQSQQAKELAKETRETNQREVQIEQQQNQNIASQTMWTVIFLVIVGGLLGAAVGVYKLYQKSQDRRLIQ